MPKVTLVNKAQKDQGCCLRCGAAIKTGDSYFWFRNRIGVSSIRKTFCRSCTPRASDLTTSDKMSRLYAAQETLDDQIQSGSSLEDLAQALRDAASEARDVGDEYRESVSNMPEQFQQGDQAQEMEEKADACESWADTLESAADEIEGMEPQDEEDKAEDAAAEDGGTTALEHAQTLAADACSELSI